MVGRIGDELVHTMRVYTQVCFLCTVRSNTKKMQRREYYKEENEPQYHGQWLQICNRNLRFQPHLSVKCVWRLKLTPSLPSWQHTSSTCNNAAPHLILRWLLVDFKASPMQRCIPRFAWRRSMLRFAIRCSEPRFAVQMSRQRLTLRCSPIRLGFWRIC